MNEQTFSKLIAYAGGRAYIVGGWNRDQLLGKQPKDKDYCVTGFNKSSFINLFPQAKQVIGKKGKQTVDVFLLDIDGVIQEVALARKEVKKGTGYHGFEFHSDENVTIEQDLLRRDLTINAIAYDLEEKRYIYPEGAMDDIKNHILRATSDAFYEDPLRVYRVAVRHAKTGFQVEERTKQMMITASKELPFLPKERVFQELKKALTAEYPDLFFRLLEELGILSIHFKPIADLKGVEQPAKFHPEGDAFEHTMNTVKAMKSMTDDPMMVFCMLVHDVGKALTPIEFLPKHPGHEERGVPVVSKLCGELGVSRNWKKAAKFATENHGRFHVLHQMRSVKVVDLLTEAEKNPLTAEGLAMVGLADARGKGNPQEEHPNYPLAIRAIEEIKQVKGDKSLKGMKAWQDKRNRQAAIIDQIRTIQTEVPQYI